jgi:ribonuclease Z
MAERSFLVQKFAKVQFGQLHVIGYSVAGEETVCQIPELNVCFDIGRSPHFALTSDIVCISHGHMDHIAGIPYYLSQRYFQGMKPGTVIVPAQIERPVDNLLRCWREVERQGTPFNLIGMMPGQTHEVRRDFLIRAIATHHGGPSLGYSLISVREKLKAEYAGTPGQQLADMRRRGIEIQYRIEVPLVTFLGDTSVGEVFKNPDVVNAEVLITECTFFDQDHKLKAKAGRHLHVDQFAQIVPELKNKYIVLSHVTRRTGIRRAKGILRKKIGDEQMQRIHFLMDFEGAEAAGEVEDIGPPPPDTAE